MLHTSRQGFRKLFVLSLIGCIVASAAASAALKSSAPKNVDLSGHWKLNAAMSEDPHAAVLAARATEKEHKQNTEKKRDRARQSAPILRGPDEGGRLPPGESRPPRPGEEPDAEEESPEEPEDPEDSGNDDPIEAALAIPEEFAIQQEAESFVLLLTESTDRCNPKRPGSVSTREAGLAKRACGWDREAFVVELSPAQGPLLTTRYELDKEKEHLLVTSEIKGELIPKIRVKRVYERVEATD